MEHLFFFNPETRNINKSAFMDFRKFVNVKTSKKCFFNKPSNFHNCNGYNCILTAIYNVSIRYYNPIVPDNLYLYFISLNTLCSDPYQAVSALQFLHDCHFHIFLLEYGLNQELTADDINHIKVKFTPKPSKKIHSTFLIRYLLSLHTIKNITFNKLEQISGINENTLKYHSNRKSRRTDFAKSMVKATASKGNLSTQEQKMIKAMRHYNQLNEETADLWLPYIDEL